MEVNMTQNKPTMQARTMAELLPCIKSILTEDAIQTLTAKKQPRATTAITRTTEKVYKPLTMAEMKTELKALMNHSPKRHPAYASARKKNWNSSVKLDKKTMSHTANGQVKQTARKLLNFQETSNIKPLTTTNPRATVNPITPKFTKPEIRAKKSLYVAPQSSVRISGVYKILETPVETKKPIQKMKSVTNKKNIFTQPTLSKRVLVPPKIILSKIPHTPVSNDSFKSSSDASFLRNEKEIHDIVEKTTVLPDERTLENIAEISPPVSTPFRKYRSVQEYFNNSSDLENSAVYTDDTIMSFDIPPDFKNNDKQENEESFHLLLCDLLQKATITDGDSEKGSLDSLLQMEKETELHLEMINKIKESQEQSLKQIRMLIESKKSDHKDGRNDKTLKEEAKPVSVKEINPDSEEMESSTIISRPSVIKSPSYKIPKKNMCLRKKVCHKSMPNVSTDDQTPSKNNNRALNMYMKMKKQMNFLNTPVAKKRNTDVPDTPAITSHNLQIQLDKLYNKS